MRAGLTAILHFLRDADWLGAGRARAYARILLGVTVVVAVAWVALSRNGLDPEGKPVGTDFVNIWTASKLALAGDASLAWSPAAHGAAQQALFGGRLRHYTPFLYPPPYLLVCLPLAVLPYFWSLALWLGATGYGFWRVARGYLPDLDPTAFLAFPAAFVNAGHGQNGFLTAALVGAGFLFLDSRPVIAGACFGAMAIKPQLVALLPFALLFGRRWTALATAAVAAAAFCGLSYAILGGSAWSGFFRASALSGAVLDAGLAGYERMQSVFAGARLLGAPLGFAYALQGFAALAALAVLFPVARRGAPGPALGAATVCACLLASPFLFDYDLTLLAVPLVVGLRAGRRTGFLPWEKCVLFAAYLLPLLSRTIAGAVGLPLAPLTIAALFAITVRRGLKPAVESEATPSCIPLSPVGRRP